MSQPLQSLTDCAPGDDRTVAAVAWDALGAGEARRLRELGLDEGVGIALLHRAPLGGTLACRIGRMTVAMRRHVAQAIQVAPAILPAE